MLVLYQPMSSPMITRILGFFVCPCAALDTNPNANTKTPNGHGPLLQTFFIAASCWFQWSRKPALAPRGIASLLWNVRIRRAGLDWRIFLQALLQVDDDFRHWYTHPGIRCAHVALFFQVGQEVDDLWEREHLWRVVHVDLPN